MRFLIINGPNLNLLGTREPDVYGSVTFDTFLQGLRDKYPMHEIGYFQSNIEGEIIDRLQDCKDEHGVILNAAAYTHTSIAIGDTVRAMVIPVIEVHISNTFARESYRHQSYISTAAKGVILGFGLQSYHLAIQAFTDSSTP